MSAYLNTMMCSLCSAPKAVGGVLVLPSKIMQWKKEIERRGEV